jgi:hypothetical protein
VYSALSQRRHFRSIRQVFITCPSSECPFTSGRCLLSSVPDLLWEDGSGKLSVQSGEYILSTIVLSSPLSTYKGFVACKNCHCHNEVPQVCGHTRTLIFKKYSKNTKREHLLQIICSSFPFPFVPLQRRRCLVAPWFLSIVLVPCAGD